MEGGSRMRDHYARWIYDPRESESSPLVLTHSSSLTSLLVVT